MLALRDNPIFQRWVNSLKGKGLFAALVPSMLASLLIAGLISDNGVTGPVGLAKLLEIPATFWLLLRGTALTMAYTRPLEGPEVDCTPLSAWDIFRGSAVPLMLEALPFFICHGISGATIMLVVPATLLIKLPALLAGIFSALGLVTIPIAALQFGALKRYGYWLTLPAYSLGWLALKLPWSGFEAICGFSAIDGVTGTGKMPIAVVMLAISLTPLLMLPAPLIALIAARASLGAAFRQLRNRFVQTATIVMATSLLIGQGVSLVLHKTVPQLLEIQPVEITPSASLRFPDKGRLLCLLEDGLLTTDETSYSKYDRDFKLVSRTRWPFNEPLYFKSGYPLPDGGLRVFGSQAIFDVDAEGRFERRDWPTSLLDSKGNPPTIRTLSGKVILADGLLASIEWAGAHTPALELTLTDPLTGELLESRPFPVGRTFDYLQQIYGYANRTEEMLVLNALSGVISAMPARGGEMTHRRLSFWENFFRCTDLAPENGVPYPLFGLSSKDESGNVIVVDRHGSGPPDDRVSIGIYVYPPHQGKPHVYEIKVEHLSILNEVLLIDEHLVLFGGGNTGGDDRQAVWSVALPDLGIQTESAE